MTVLNIDQNSQGSALVELAIVLTCYLMLFFWFWDTAAKAIMIQRQEILGFLITSDYVEAPLKLESNEDGTVSANKLDDTAANTYMNNIIVDFRSQASELGAGADYVSTNMMMELHYLSIHSPEDSIPLGETRNDGYPYADSRAGDATYAGSTNSSDCFDSGDSTQFSDYVTTKINRLLNYDINNDPPIGTKAYETQWAGSTAERYVKFKPIIFMMMCSKPPRVFTSESIKTFRVFFPPKEVGFP